MDAKKLLADLLQWPEEKIDQAIACQNDYQLIRLKKKNGSFRNIYRPVAPLKKMQRRLLKYFIYRLPYAKPGFSYTANARYHSLIRSNFVLRLDLKNCFPSVKIGWLKNLLQTEFENEIKKYAKQENSFLPLFPNKKVGWFRYIIKNPRQLHLFSDPQQIIKDFIELILQLTTHKNHLPQGVPTSPALLKFVLGRLDIFEKICDLLSKERNSSGQMIMFSVYVDDFTFSSEKPISRKIQEELIKQIETGTPFKVNRNKTQYFDRRRIAPLITGLRLVKMRRPKQELENKLSNLDLSPKQKKNIIRRQCNLRGEWEYNAVSFPKSSIRRIRGFIHRSCGKKNLASKINGYLACLKDVYQGKIPKQITTPYQKYLESIKGLD